MFDVRFERAVAAFDAANGEDPNWELVDGVRVPHELADARRLSAWVERLAPGASVALRLACRCQHIRRWEVPRSRYPMTRVGYLEWRRVLRVFHAEVAGSILRDVGFGEDVVGTVRGLNLKEDLEQGGEAQVLEDALCLVFLEFELEGFRKRVDEDRLAGILRRCWGKMSERGRAEALGLSLSSEVRGLLDRTRGVG